MASVTRLITIGGVVLVTMIPCSAAADADGSCSATGSIAGCLGDRNGTIDVTGEIYRGGRQGHESRPDAASAISPEAVATAAYCADAAANASAATTTAAFAEVVPLCGFAPSRGRVAPPSQDQVLAAFREIGLYRGAVRSDPERVSFVNLETYFWCGDGAGTCAALGEAERTVTLLGQAVRIRPRIVSYEWRFGDGSSQSVIAGRVAHTYGRSGAMAVSVTLTWTADYAVGGGGFRAIGGTTATTSPVRVLPVQEAETVSSG